MDAVLISLHLCYFACIFSGATCQSLLTLPIFSTMFIISVDSSLCRQDCSSSVCFSEFLAYASSRRYITPWFSIFHAQNITLPVSPKAEPHVPCDFHKAEAGQKNVGGDWDHPPIKQSNLWKIGADACGS